jgi:hypothetical protein
MERGLHLPKVKEVHMSSSNEATGTVSRDHCLDSNLRHCQRMSKHYRCLCLLPGRKASGKSVNNSLQQPTGVLSTRSVRNALIWSKKEATFAFGLECGR